jgi:hypothetical protein
LVLLACTLLGLAAMHVLGHSAHHSPPINAAMTATISGHVVVDGCPDGHCEHPSDSGRGRHEDTPAWGVCLAVLAGFGIAMLIAWLLLGSGKASGVGPPPGRVDCGVPHVPAWQGVGLRLATGSVLRI